MAVNIFAGREADLQVFATSSGPGVSFGVLKDFELNVDRDQIDVTSFDSAGWKEWVPGNAGWGLNAGALMVSTGATAETDTLRGYLSSETRAYYWIMNTSTTATAGYTWHGFGYVSNFKVGGDVDGVQLNGFEIQGDGTLNETST